MRLARGAEEGATCASSPALAWAVKGDTGSGTTWYFAAGLPVDRFEVLEAWDRGESPFLDLGESPPCPEPMPANWVVTVALTEIAPSPADLSETALCREPPPPPACCMERGVEPGLGAGLTPGASRSPVAVREVR